MTRATVARNGAAFFYTSSGDGDPPVLFVHGSLTSHRDWRHQVTALAGKRRVLAVDLRGHGQSSARDPATCTIAHFAEDVLALIEELALPPTVLIGHSMGCRVVLQAYAEAPERVAGVALVDSSRVEATRGSGAGETLLRAIRSDGHEATIRRFFSGMFVESSNPAVRDEVISQALRVPAQVFESVLTSTIAWDASRSDDALAQVAVPFLVIQSTDVGPDLIRRSLSPGESSPWLDIVRSVTDAAIEIVPDVGHYCMLEAPDAVSRAIAGFADRCAMA